MTYLVLTTIKDKIMDKNQVPIFKLERCLIGVSLALACQHMDMALPSFLYRRLLGIFSKEPGAVEVYVDVKNAFCMVEADFERLRELLDAMEAFLTSEEIFDLYGPITPTYRVSGMCSVSKDGALSV